MQKSIVILASLFALALFLLGGFLILEIRSSSREVALLRAEVKKQEEILAKIAALRSELRVEESALPNVVGATTSNKTVSGATYTLATVATHNSPNNCWVVIGSSIYDVTAFIKKHPGGEDPLSAMCGKDASAIYRTKGLNPGRSHSAFADQMLPTYFIAKLGTAMQREISTLVQPPPAPPTATRAGVTSPTVTSATPSTPPPSPTSTPAPAPTPTPPPSPTPSPTPTPTSPQAVYTAGEVSAHNSQGNCWLIVQSRVYNVTPFISVHPGGAEAITMRCGTDATTVFTTNGSGGHAHSNYAISLLPTYYVGDLPGTATPPPSPTPTPTSPTPPSPSPASPTTYTVTVSSAGNYSPTTLTLASGDSIIFVYSAPIGAEVRTRFTPATISAFTLDHDITQGTRTFTTPGTYTFKADDHNGNTGTVIVQ